VSRWFTARGFTAGGLTGGAPGPAGLAAVLRDEAGLR
jgi:hypothetical protein